MARVRIQDENREITTPAEIAVFLKPFGIQYERWEVAGRLNPSSTNEEILSVYGPEIERLKKQGGYVTADVINVHPQTPNLDAMLAKFSREHTHSEDEVRFVVEGRGVFTIHPAGGPVFAIQVEDGDLINVPAGTKHWFDLCADRHIRCIRLFLDPAGWAPAYTDSGIDKNYQALCFGPNYLPADKPELAGAVKP
jgi:1,2-dihydroxy-3-keto-5-methylthiopentene dioxygenase